MNIVLLDTNTITNGDVSLEEITSLGNTTCYDLLSHEEILEVVRRDDANVIISNKSVLDAEVFDAAPNLKLVGVFATGYNNIDLEEAKKRGILAVNVPGYSTDSVAGLTWAMILEFATSLSKYDKSVQAGDWTRVGTFSYFADPIFELTGKTLGIYGLGNIGSKVAKIGMAFGMNVIYYNRTPKSFVATKAPIESDIFCDDGVRPKAVDVETLFREADFLSFHCALTKETEGIVNKDTLKLMKPSAFLINTCRGGVIVEEDLKDALNNDVIAGAGIDVLTVEPMPVGHPYLSAKNMILTPHVAWASIEARKRLITLVAGNIKAFADGKPVNVVNK